MKLAYESEDGNIFYSSDECREYELLQKVKETIITAAFVNSYSAETQAKAIIKKFFLTERPVQMELPKKGD